MAPLSNRPRRETLQGCVHVPKEELKISAEGVAEREADSAPQRIGEWGIVLLNVHWAQLPFKRLFSQNAQGLSEDVCFVKPAQVREFLLLLLVFQTCERPLIPPCRRATWSLPLIIGAGRLLSSNIPTSRHQSVCCKCSRRHQRVIKKWNCLRVLWLPAQHLDWGPASGAKWAVSHPAWGCGVFFFFSSTFH